MISNVMRLACVFSLHLVSSIANCSQPFLSLFALYQPYIRSVPCLLLSNFCFFCALRLHLSIIAQLQCSNTRTKQRRVVLVMNCCFFFFNQKATYISDNILSIAATTSYLYQQHSDGRFFSSRLFSEKPPMCTQNVNYS